MLSHLQSSYPHVVMEEGWMGHLDFMVMVVFREWRKPHTLQLITQSGRHKQIEMNLGSLTYESMLVLSVRRLERQDGLLQEADRSTRRALWVKSLSRTDGRVSRHQLTTIFDTLRVFLPG